MSVSRESKLARESVSLGLSEVQIQKMCEIPHLGDGLARGQAKDKASVVEREFGADGRQRSFKLFTTMCALREGRQSTCS